MTYFIRLCKISWSSACLDVSSCHLFTNRLGQSGSSPTYLRSQMMNLIFSKVDIYCCVYINVSMLIIGVSALKCVFWAKRDYKKIYLPYLWLWKILWTEYSNRQKTEKYTIKPNECRRPNSTTFRDASKIWLPMLEISSLFVTLLNVGWK